jgi:hypothetical protein
MKAKFDEAEAAMPEADRQAHAGLIAKARSHTDEALKHMDLQPVAKFYNHGWGSNVGAHATPEVLTRESSLVATIPHAKELRKMREVTGEANFVKRVTGHEYGSTPLRGKVHSKARTFGDDDLELDPFGIPQSVHHVD